MLGKLFKHEWRAISRLLLLAHAAVLIVAIVSRIGMEALGGFNSDSIFMALIMFAYIIAIGCASIFTFIYLAMRFYKSVYTDEGYLTNTLPVTPAQLIWSKLLAALLWTVIDFVAITISIMILIATPETMGTFGEIFREIGKFFSNGEGSFVLSFVLQCVSMVISVPMQILILYFAISLGSQFAGHRVMGSVISYFGIYILLSVINVGTMLIFAGSDFFDMTTHSSSVVGQIRMLQSLNTYTGVDIAIAVAISAGLFLGCRYFMTKKLNLE